MTIRTTFYIPNKNVLTAERYTEITQEDCHPTKEELAVAFLVTVRRSFSCGAVLRLESEYYGFDKFYFLSRDGLELIEV